MADPAKPSTAPVSPPLGRSAPVPRVTAYPLIILICLGLACGLIAVFAATLPPAAAALLIDLERPTFPLTVQNVMWLVFALGCGELLVRLIEARAEQRELAKGYLPEDDVTVLQIDDMPGLFARARQAMRQPATARRFMPRLIERIVSQVQVNRSAQQANTILNSSLELALHEIDLRYAMIRYVVWAIPTLGFIGTVIGISLALAYAGAVDLQDPTLLAELTKRLAVAFNTTLLALAMSAVLVLIQHLVQAYEERALNRVGQYCLDHLINRLYLEP